MSSTFNNLHNDYQIVDDYTGHVDSQGPATRRIVNSWDGPAMSIIKFSTGNMNNNVYFVTCLNTDTSIIIDCAWDAERILGFLQAADIHNVQEIITTHGHFDHWQALEQVASTLKVPTAVGINDSEALPIECDRLIEDGDSFTVGKLICEPLWLRGHTPGSIALSFTVDGHTHIFSGDALFPGGVGKTHSSRDFQTLLADVETKIFDRYLDTAVFYPGHGDDSTLGAQRPQLGEWRQRGW